MAFLNGAISAGFSYFSAIGNLIPKTDKFAKYTVEIIFGLGGGLANEGSSILVNTIEDRPLVNTGYVEYFYEKPKIGYKEHFHDGRKGYRNPYHYKMG